MTPPRHPPYPPSNITNHSMFLRGGSPRRAVYLLLSQGWLLAKAVSSFSSSSTGVRTRIRTSSHAGTSRFRSEPWYPSVGLLPSPLLHRNRLGSQTSLC